MKFSLFAHMERLTVDQEHTMSGKQLEGKQLDTH